MAGPVMLFSLLIAVLWHGRCSPTRWRDTPDVQARRRTSGRGTHVQAAPAPNAAEPGRASAWRLRPCARSAGISGPPAAAAAQRTHRRSLKVIRSRARRCCLIAVWDRRLHAGAATTGLCTVPAGL